MSVTVESLAGQSVRIPSMARQRLWMWLDQLFFRFQVRGVPRLVYATRGWIFGRGLQAVRVSEGPLLVLNMDDYFQCMMAVGKFAPEIVALIKSCLRVGDVFVDVGAHIGYLTMIARQCVGKSGIVLALEPDPRVFEFLQASVALNGSENVKCLRLAAGDTQGTLQFTLSPTFGWSTAIQAPHRPGRQVVVEQETLTNILDREIGSMSVRLIKMDCEGYEPFVIKGLADYLQDQTPDIICELGKPMLQAGHFTPAAVIEPLLKLGYSCWIVRPVRPSIPKLFHGPVGFGLEPYSDQAWADEPEINVFFSRLSNC